MSLSVPDEPARHILCACGALALVGLEDRWFCAACFDAAFEAEIRPILQRLREEYR